MAGALSTSRKLKRAPSGPRATPAWQDQRRLSAPELPRLGLVLVGNAARVEQRNHFLVVDLVGVSVVHADRPEGTRLRQADHVVDQLRQFGDRVVRRNRHGQHHLGRSHAAQRFQGSAHCGAGGDAVVDDDDRPAGNSESGQAVPIRLASPDDLAALLSDLALDIGMVAFGRLRRAFVDHHRRWFALGDGGHGKLRITWRADLAHDQQIHRRGQRERHLGGHRHAAAWQGEHQGVDQPKAKDGGSQLPAGFPAIFEVTQHVWPLFQCAINTGSVIVCNTLRDAPPSMNSRAWLWP